MWMTFLATSDADATAAKIKGAGGQLIMEAMDVMDAGRMAVAVDPASAVFGIWQARAFPGAQIVNEPGAMRWNEQVSDASVARVQANGGSVIREPIDHPYGRMSTVADDQGAVFSLLGVTPG
jgi:predicted enzyme related to lactoylglutathione lyase